MNDDEDRFRPTNSPSDPQVPGPDPHHFIFCFVFSTVSLVFS